MGIVSIMIIQISVEWERRVIENNYFRYQTMSFQSSQCSIVTVVKRSIKSFTWFFCELLSSWLDTYANGNEETALYNIKMYYLLQMNGVST